MDPANGTAADRLAQTLSGMREVERSIRELAAAHAVGDLEFVWNRGALLKDIPPSIALEVTRPSKGNVSFTFPSEAIAGYLDSAAAGSTQAAIGMILRSLKITS